MPVKKSFVAFIEWQGIKKNDKYVNAAKILSMCMHDECLLEW